MSFAAVAIAAVLVLLIVAVLFRKNIAGAYSRYATGGDVSAYDGMSTSEIMKQSDARIREMMK